MKLQKRAVLPCRTASGQEVTCSVMRLVLCPNHKQPLISMPVSLRKLGGRGKFRTISKGTGYLCLKLVNYRQEIQAMRNGHLLRPGATASEVYYF